MPISNARRTLFNAYSDREVAVHPMSKKNRIRIGKVFGENVLTIQPKLLKLISPKNNHQVFRGVCRMGVFYRAYPG